MTIRPPSQDSLIPDLVSTSKTFFLSLVDSNHNNLNSAAAAAPPTVLHQRSVLALLQHLALVSADSVFAVLPKPVQRTLSHWSWRKGSLLIVAASTVIFVLFPSVLELQGRKRTKSSRHRKKNSGQSDDNDNDDDLNDDDMMLMRRKKKAGKHTVGLLNPANDCFANSNLQALASLRILYGYISHLALILPPNPDQLGPEPSPSKKGDSAPLALSIALGKAIVQLNEPILSPKSASPWPFLHVLEKFYNSQISRNQHDAHELLHLILETLETEHSHISKIYNGKTSPSKKVVIPDFPFQGMTIDRITCSKCGYSPTTSSATFIVFSLMVPQKRSANLTDLLAEVSSPEYIKDYGCTKCRVSHVRQLNKDAELVKQLEEYTTDQALLQLPDALESQLPKGITSSIAKSMQFGKLPQILTIHLSRSIYGGFGASRNSCKVNVVEFLELMEQPPTSTPAAGVEVTMNSAARMLGSRTKVTYKLMAMIRHKGTHYAGHYECFRRKNLDWWIDHLPSFKPDPESPPPPVPAPVPVPQPQQPVRTPTPLNQSSSEASVGTAASSTPVTSEPTPTSDMSTVNLNGTTNGTTTNGNGTTTEEEHEEHEEQEEEEDSHAKLPFPQARLSKVSTPTVDTTASNPTPASPPAAPAAAPGSASAASSSPSLSPQPMAGTGSPGSSLAAVARYFGPDVAAPSQYEWWKISDDKTWECSTRDVLKEESGAYLLFYERVVA